MNQDVLFLRDLTPEQIRLIDILLSAPTKTEAAVVAGLARQTIYRALSDPAFRTALHTAQVSLYAESAARLASLRTKAIDVAVGLLGSSSEHVALKAAALLIQAADESHDKTVIQTQMDEIQQMLEGSE